VESLTHLAGVLHDLGDHQRAQQIATGGVFLLFSLAVFVIAEFGHDVDPVPAAPAELVGQEASGGGLSDPAISSSAGAVTVQFNDQLTDGALQEEIQVTVDGQYVGDLRADVTSPSDTIEFSVDEGSHYYAMVGALQAQDGSEYTIAGEGTFEGRAGASFDLSLTDSRELSLSRRELTNPHMSTSPAAEVAGGTGSLLRVGGRQ
jgi:hypothetical protein